MKTVRRVLPVLYLIGLAAGSAAPLDAPKAVIQQILSGLTKAGDDPNEKAYEPCPSLCDPAFAELKRRSDLLGSTDEDMPYDYDVFCQCQDYDHQTFRIVSDRMVDAAHYEAKVVGSDKGEKPWTIVLAKIAGAWKVSDVIDESGSVRAGIQKALNRKKR